ncbi:hypothetical protein OPT61_g7997 [Boeremia exigua]|uniref:Uncharacterized protein n=1 Tax=Boeremia exigua TaxID=749465 RepID=A0ACC2I146_9PLEO|nr:hypothetical protein OPT61_g7997 [Boeremia exigua]
MFCDVCRKIGLATDGKAELVIPKQIMLHHRTWSSLRHSVLLGCYLCNHIWESFSAEEQHFISDLVVKGCDDTNCSLAHLPNHYAGINYNGGGVTAAAWFKDEIHSSYELLVYIFKDTGPSRNCSFIVQLREALPSPNIAHQLSNNTKSEATFSLARKWIENCLASHKACNVATDHNTWYPSRLLDCSPNDSPEADCRLLETATSSVHEPYMTLSHCWGDVDCLKLTTENRAQMMKSTPLSTMPKLYQDAVLVTRALGVRYLWIDSLCIIQEGDQLEDWFREVKMMDQIYLHSICNISAANARNGNCTMFSSRRQELVCPQVVALNINDATDSYMVSSKSLWRRQVSNSLINTRGWVVQERLLSPRILYFGETQIFWECRQNVAAEIHPMGLSREHIENPLDFPKLLASRLEERVATSIAWCSIVCAYTACQLTFPRDKLSALSAVAKVARRRCNGEYVAGMWRQTLDRELFWYASVNATRPDMYRAPSWSWMSLDGVIVPDAVIYEDPDFRILHQIVDLEIDYMTSDDTGPISGGYLRLLGALKKCQLVRTDPDPSNSRSEYLLSDGTQSGSSPKPLVNSFVSLDPPYRSNEIQNTRTKLCYMLLMRRRTNMEWLLLEVVDKDEGVYRRMGVALLSPDTAQDYNSHEEDGSLFPCEEYKDGQYMIRII